MQNNHENVPRYTATFADLTSDELDELLSVVFRECGGNTAEKCVLSAGPN